MLIKTFSFDQLEILSGIMELYAPDGFEADISYGNGSFYKNVKKPHYKYDINPQVEGVIEACSTRLPNLSETLSSVVFDPPFLTYVRQGREGNGKMIMANRFSGYWRYDELEEHYKNTLKECHRVLKKKGIIVFKCQDIIHNHKMHCTHANAINWAKERGFSLLDLFVLGATHRLPSPNRKGKQKHARIFHSFFLILQKQ